MQIFGGQWKRRDLEARTGRIDQLGGTTRLRLQEGSARDVEIIEVRTGAGLRYTIVPERGMDIYQAEFLGTPISWLSGSGPVHPSYFTEHGVNWLRTAAGGLLMTCGLRQVGAPNEDGGETLGIHGRAHHTAAEQVTAVSHWVGEECLLRVSGVLRESRLFGEHLLVHRTITSHLGRNVIVLEDTIENIGFQTQPLMMLYHFNFGWPFLSPNSEIDFPSGLVSPRDPETPREKFNRMEDPDPNFTERVYFHELLDTEKGLATVRLRQPSFPAGSSQLPVEVRLSWGVEQLPELIQWKMCGAGAYVMGVEPANCRVMGRHQEREAGRLKYIEPGARSSHYLKLELHA